MRGRACRHVGADGCTVVKDMLKCKDGSPLYRVAGVNSLPISYLCWRACNYNHYRMLHTLLGHYSNVLGACAAAAAVQAEG